MGFLTTVVIGAIIGWFLHLYLPTSIVDTVDNSTKGLCGKILAYGAPESSTSGTPSGGEKSRSAKPAAKDDLKKIEGIGPKIAGLMNDDGINSYQDLASTTVTRLRGILEKAGSRYRIADPTTWPKQAKLAAKKDWDGLKALKDELKGGREKG